MKMLSIATGLAFYAMASYARAEPIEEPELFTYNMSQIIAVSVMCERELTKEVTYMGNAALTTATEQLGQEKYSAIADQAMLDLIAEVKGDREQWCFGKVMAVEASYTMEIFK